MLKVTRIIISLALLLTLVSVVSADDRAEVIGRDEASLKALVSRLAGQPVAEVIGGDEASLRTMAAVLAGGGPGAANQKVTVYVGALPESLPFEFPTPENTTIIGSVDRGQLGGISIMLDVPLVSDDIVAFYKDALKGDNWKALEGVPGASGFVSQPSSYQQFCYQPDEGASASVMINAQTKADGKNSAADIYVYSPADPGACQGISEAGYTPGNDPYSLLPQLKTPDGVELVPQFGGGGGGGGGTGYRQASVSATLKSEMPIADIATAYNKQLEDFGWKLVDSEDGVHLAYSGWNLTDLKGVVWAGTFSLIANPALENHYMATLSVQEIPSDK